MTTTLHAAAPIGQIHSPVNWIFSTAAARQAVGMYTTLQLGCEALQTDTSPPTLWKLFAVASPGSSATPTWRQVTTTADSGGGGGADPSTIITSVPILAWYRGDTVVQSSSLVSQWTDKKNTNHAVQATGANQPAYNATDSTLNNQPTLTGNGTSTELLCAGVVLPASYYMWAVLKINAFSGSTNVAFSSPGGSGKAMLYWNSGTALYIFENGSFDGPLTTTLGAWKRVAVAQSNATSDFIKCGAATPATGALGRTATSNAWRIFDTGSAGQFWNGAFAEIVITTGIPTSGEQTALDTYGSGRYLASILT